MEVPYVVRRAISHDGLNGRFAGRPPHQTNDRYHDPLFAARRRNDENTMPPALPQAFQGMLKTTTETGDIGIFSIRPSRIPHSTISAQSFPRNTDTSYRDGPLQSASYHRCVSGSSSKPVKRICPTQLRSDIGIDSRLYSTPAHMASWTTGDASRRMHGIQ